MKDFFFWSSIQSNSHISPHSLIPSSSFPHTLIWWCTCWSGSCTLLRIVDSQDLIHDSWLCNIFYIWYLIWNIINTCMKGLHSPCSWITSFHGFGFNLEVVLYHIYEEFYMSFMILGNQYLCKTMYFNSYMIFILKSKKILCEKLAFSCHCITSFHGFWLQSWCSFIPYLYEGYYTIWMMLWQKYMTC